MSSYLRPRRGKNATAVSQLGSNAPLKRGEVFFEVPDTGVGTGLGKIKMGDGSTAYANLPYFLEQLDLDNAKVAFTDSNTPDANPYTTNTTLATAIAPTASMKTIFTNLKQLLVNHNAQLTQLNNEIGGVGDLTVTSATYKVTATTARYYVSGKLMFIYLFVHIPNITIPNNTVFLGISPHGLRFTNVNAINLSTGHGCILATASNGDIQTSADSSNTITANTNVIITGVVPLIV